MLEQQLRDQMSLVGRRLERLWLWRRLTGCWIGFAALALVWWGLGRPFGFAFGGIIGAAWLTATILWVRSKSSSIARADIARHVERVFPELNSRLLAALEQCPDVQTGRWNVLQRQVIAEALHHSRINDWTDAVPAKRMRNAFLGQTAALVAFVTICICLVPSAAQTKNSVTGHGPFQSAQKETDQPLVEPGDAEIERGSSPLVLARFSTKLPAGVNLVWRAAASGEEKNGTQGTQGTDATPSNQKSQGSHQSPSTEAPSQEQRQPLTKSLDDPIFGGRLPSVKHDLTYLIDFDGRQTREYKLTVYDLPSLVRSDLELRFPGYTSLETKKLEDAFEATVVEGTTIGITCRVNKPLATVKLIDLDGTSLALTADPANPLVYRTDFVPKKRHRMKLELTDGAGRANRDPEEFRFEAIPNRPPELKLAFPGQDVKVSPLEEVLVEATASDDFGLVETGLVLSIPGREPLTIMLGKDQLGSQQRKLSHLQRLEELNVEPDELISYYVYADDFGPDGQPRRTSSDLFFAEVRPFEEIFRQLESPPGGSSQAAGSQQQGNPLTKLAELQKQIVVATWKLARSQRTKWDTKLAEQVTVIRNSQQKAIEQLEALAEKLTDTKAQPILTSIGEKMAAADRSLGHSLNESSLTPLTAAAAAEQAAYQGLLKLRAREHLMMKGSQSSSGSGGSSSVSEQQLSQLELDNKKNRYESQKAGQQQTGQQQREDLAMLDRLKELAKRQEGVNEQLKELEAALRTAKTEAEKEELERQLKRLRDDQQQLLHDADELRNKMAQSPQQEKLNDTRQQLEQTRQQMVDATEKLREGQLSQALNAGTRAERELQQLQEDFRKQTSAQFADAMRSLREEARQLAENEKQLAERLAALQDEAKRSLRQSKDRQALETEFKEQRQQTNELVDAAKGIVEQSETAEPLLSKQLYDTVRSSREMKTDQALDATSQLLRAGFLPEAQKAEEQAREGIDRLKQGIEKATEGILGDEVESLKRARRELAELAEQLDKELAMQQPGGGEKKPGEQGAGDSKANSTAGEGQSAKPGQPGQNGEKPGQGEGQQGTGKPSQNGQDSKSDKPGSGEGTPKEGQPPKEGQQQQGAGKQPGQGQKGQGQKGKGQGQGEGQPGQSPGGKVSPQEGQPSPNGQPGQAGSQGEGAGGQGESPGGESSNKPGRGGLRGQPQRGGAKPSPGNPRGGDQGGTGGGPGSANEGPLTGEKFSEWNERLRDVESMVSDPKLQAEVAKVRERARSVRAEFKRHSQTPNWDLVRTTVREPLTELQRQLAEEISRRESPDSLVPVDRDPVPTRYRDLVRGYYERLGSGKADGSKPK